MKARRLSSAGFAMLVVLLVIVLAATFALMAAAAVHSSQVVERADAAAWRATMLEGRAAAAVADALRWSPAFTSGSVAGVDHTAGGSWGVEWSPAPAVAGIAWPRVTAGVTGFWGAAGRREDLTLELRAEPWGRGVTCEGDADVDADLIVSGSGIYLGGCLRGRENVRFVADTGVVTTSGEAADLVRSDVFPVAAVHGGAGIFAHGIEIHESGAPAEFLHDTDRHEGLPARPEWLTGPSGEFLAAAAPHALTPGPWLQDGRLVLDEVPPAGATGDGGRCIVLSGPDELVVEGSAPAAAGRLLVIIRGDAVVGQPGQTVELSGGLVVLGSLSIRGELRLTGSLHAGAVAIRAPVRIVVPGDWQRRPLVGAALPVVVERGR